jgi:hypothetical protein
MKITTINPAILLITLVTVVGLATPLSADPYCRACPNSCEDLGLGSKDCSELPRARGLCCVDLTKKGLKLAQELDRASGPARETAERCPNGFHPSEQKCSPEERRRGCKDMRLPGGLGCVRR